MSSSMRVIFHSRMLWSTSPPSSVHTLLSPFPRSICTQSLHLLYLHLFVQNLLLNNHCPLPLTLFPCHPLLSHHLLILPSKSTQIPSLPLFSPTQQSSPYSTTIYRHSSLFSHPYSSPLNTKSDPLSSLPSYPITYYHRHSKPPFKPSPNPISSSPCHPLPSFPITYHCCHHQPPPTPLPDPLPSSIHPTLSIQSSPAPLPPFTNPPLHASSTPIPKPLNPHAHSLLVSSIIKPLLPISSFQIT